MKRVHFVIGAAGTALALPCRARGAEEQYDEPAKPGGSPVPHVHGPNGVVRLPPDRPINWVLETLDGPRFRLDAYRGKVVFLNVFATWCEPCRAEQPDVVAFAAAHAEDTAVIGIDVREEDDTVRAYRKKFAITYPLAMDRHEEGTRAIYARGDGGIAYPLTVVIRPDGYLSCAWVGSRDRAWFEAEREAALGA